MNSYFHSEYQESDFLKIHFKELRKIQAFCRRIVIRNWYLKKIKEDKPIYYYFNSDEIKFFISKNSRLSSYRENVSGKLYKNGGCYSGEMRGGFRDGKGVMEWKDGAKYEGNWSFGIPAGYGEFTYPDEETYQGLWKNYYNKGTETEITGLGLILWKENVTDGYKWLWCKKAISMNSPCSKSVTPRNEEKLQETQGRYLELKQLYDIKSRQTLKPVKETFHKYMDRSIYNGDMENNQRHGIGTLSWPDGDVYQGEWKENIQCGWGKNSWSEGSSYTGLFVNNLKEGIGLYTWADGAEYLGEWKANKMNGIGRYTWTDGKLYLGEWIDGIMQGFGVLMWKDGRKYEGTWLGGKKHGEGVTYYSNGRLSRDIWRYGKIIRPDV